MQLIILAAGQASRMGSPKQLKRIGTQSMLERACQLALNISEEVICVLGAHYDQIIAQTDFQGVQAVQNPNWETGMGSSIARGISHLKQAFPESNGVLIILADQPFIESSYLKHLIQVFEENDQARIVASKYPNRSGVPAIFPTSSFEQLIQLNGQAGARSVIRQASTITIEAPANALIDIDTPEDYANYIEKG